MQDDNHLVEMVDLYADADDEVVLDFKGGVKVVFTRWMNAGIQDELERDLVRIDVGKSEGKSEGSDDATQEAYISPGNLALIQLMIKRIEGPGGKIQRAPIGKQTIRRFGRKAMVMMVNAIQENNPPLATLRQEVMDAQKGSQDST